jgi:hypothetical protein
LASQRIELFFELTFAAAHNRRQNRKARALRQPQHPIDHLLHRLRRDGQVAAMTVHGANSRVQKPQIVVNFRDRTDGGARIFAGRFLFDRDRW